MLQNYFSFAGICRIRLSEDWCFRKSYKIPAEIINLIKKNLNLHHFDNHGICFAPAYAERGYSVFLSGFFQSID